VDVKFFPATHERCAHAQGPGQQTSGWHDLGILGILCLLKKSIHFFRSLLKIEPLQGRGHMAGVSLGCVGSAACWAC
jgi:hypothetical protein